MGKSKHSSNSVSTEVENKNSKQAPQEAPETLVVDNPPPKPNYPHYRVKPEQPITLAYFDPNASEDYEKEKDVEKELQQQLKRLRDLQRRLYAENQQSLLIVLQAMDTGGKDGTIKHVFSGINPQGCQVWSFKTPSAEEASHDFLWRYHQHAPQRGMIAIFNRSHYEDVLIVRVRKLIAESDWQKRYQIINEFENLLTLNKTTIIKFFLHISKEEQKQRLESRLANPNNPDFSQSLRKEGSKTAKMYNAK